MALKEVGIAKASSISRKKKAASDRRTPQRMRACGRYSKTKHQDSEPYRVPTVPLGIPATDLLPCFRGPNFFMVDL
jgi:hypothetical protein